MVWKIIISAAVLIYSLGFAYEKYADTVKYNEGIYQFCIEQTEGNRERVDKCMEVFKKYHLPW